MNNSPYTFQAASPPQEPECNNEEASAEEEVQVGSDESPSSESPPSADPESGATSDSNPAWVDTAAPKRKRWPFRKSGLCVAGIKALPEERSSSSDSSSGATSPELTTPEESDGSVLNTTLEDSSRDDASHNQFIIHEAQEVGATEGEDDATDQEDAQEEVQSSQEGAGEEEERPAQSQGEEHLYYRIIPEDSPQGSRSSCGQYVSEEEVTLENVSRILAPWIPDSEPEYSMHSDETWRWTTTTVEPLVPLVGQTEGAWASTERWVQITVPRVNMVPPVVERVESALPSMNSSNSDGLSCLLGSDSEHAEDSQQHPEAEKLETPVVEGEPPVGLCPIFLAGDLVIRCYLSVLSYW
jgi:hypothetical protein